MEILTKELNAQIQKINKNYKNKSDLNDDFLEHLYSIYPFNKFEYIITHLIDSTTISLEQYLDIRNEYLDRNQYLYIFEITAPRTFGETWAQNHLNVIVPELQKPKKSLDKNYSGEYDFWYEGIKIEVKASRAMDKDSKEPLVMKALSSHSKKSFDMNFQQIKPSCCDVFVWIGVWTDKIRYWVLSNDEVQNHKYYSKGQHRGNNGEGQLWITEKNVKEFEPYEVSVRDILSKIIEKSKK